MTTPRRGRPPRIARDIAVMCALAWFKEAERLPAVAAALAVRDLWLHLGWTGLGQPTSKSPVVFEKVRLATHAIGPGRFVALPGLEVGGVMRDAAVYYVVNGSAVLSPFEGGGQVVRGTCWRWPFGAEEAEFLSGDRAASGGGDGRAGAWPRVSLGQGPGVGNPVPEPVLG